MTCPFPGMDPYLESRVWPDFHTTFVVALKKALNRIIGPKYLARIDDRVYLQTIESRDASHPERQGWMRRPDVSVTEDNLSVEAVGSVSTIVADEPTTCLLPDLEEVHEPYIEILDEASGSVVCAVELLSPANKTAAGNGRGAYLWKREHVLRSSTHLVELDFLRGGQRLPMGDSLPDGDYYAIVSPARSRPRADVYAWVLPSRFPKIKVPLLEEDPAVVLDLQEVFEKAYEDGDFARMLIHERGKELSPAPPSPQRTWIDGILKGIPRKSP